jgi:hypothetical protein
MRRRACRQHMYGNANVASEQLTVAASGGGHAREVAGHLRVDEGFQKRCVASC